MAVLCASVGLDAAAQPRADQIWHEPTELGWIIAALSPIGIESGHVIARGGSYYRAVEQWFAPFRAHPAVVALGADFNLPRLVGNAASYEFTSGSRLRRMRGAVPLWGDAAGDLFTQHLRLIEDFVERSRARTFLARERATIVAGATDLYRAVDLGDIQRWLEAQFRARPKQARLFVSPLTSGWNWTSLNEVRPKIWVPAPKPQTFVDPVQRFVTIGTVFTEVDHNYVNPATAVRRVIIESLLANRSAWGAPQAWQNYETAELVFNEYLTWAAFLEYASDRMTAGNFHSLRQRTNDFMEKQRGFTRFGLVRQTLAEVRRDSQQPIEQLLDELIANLRSIT